MTEPILDSPRVVVVIGQGVAAGVPEHVSMHRKRQASALAETIDVAIDGIRV